MKICPRCKLKSPIDAQFCGSCGHAFKTKFVAVPSQAQVSAVIPIRQRKPKFVLLLLLILLLIPVLLVTANFAKTKNQKDWRKATDGLYLRAQLYPTGAVSTCNFYGVEVKNGEVAILQGGQSSDPRDKGSSTWIRMSHSPFQQDQNGILAFSADEYNPFHGNSTGYTFQAKPDGIGILTRLDLHGAYMLFKVHKKPKDFAEFKSDIQSTVTGDELESVLKMVVGEP